MSEMVLEKLIQKVSNMLDEIADVNIHIRRLPPTQETLNRINERVDAGHTVLKQLEKGVTLDEKKLEELQAQTQTLKEELQAQTKSLKEELKSAGMVAHSSLSDMREQMKKAEAAINGVNEVLKTVGVRIDQVNSAHWQSKTDDKVRWDQLNATRETVFWVRVANGVLLLIVLCILLFRSH